MAVAGLGVGVLDLDGVAGEVAGVLGVVRGLDDGGEGVEEVLRPVDDGEPVDELVGGDGAEVLVLGAGAGVAVGVVEAEFHGIRGLG